MSPLRAVGGRLPLAIVALVTFATCTKAGSNHPAAPAPRAGAVAAPTTPGTESWTHVADPLPAIRAVLADPRVSAVFSGPDARAVWGREIDLAAVRRAVDGASSWIPQRLALALDNRVWELAPRTLGVVELTLASVAARGLGGSDGDALLARARDELIAALEDIPMPNLSGVVEMRTPEDARAAFQLARHTLERLPLAVPRTVDQDRLSAEFGVFGFAARSSVVAGVAGVVGGGPDSAQAVSTIVDRLGALRVRVRLEVEGRRLTATVGDGAAIPPRRDPAALVETGWDFRSMLEQGEELARNAAWWHESPIGPSLRTLRAETTGSLAHSLEQLFDRPATGYSSVHVDGGRLRVSNFRYGESATALRGSALAGLIPPSAGMIVLDQRATLGATIRSGLLRAQRQLRRANDDDTEDGTALSEIDALLVRTEQAEQLFLPGLAVVAASGRMRVTESADALRVSELPVALAVIGRVASPQSARRWLDETYTELSGAHSEERAVPVRDLGLGVDAHVFRGGALANLGVVVQAPEDVVPHYFFHRGFVVISTSRALSRAVLGARGFAPAPDLVGFGRVSGAFVDRVLRVTQSWLTGNLPEAVPYLALARGMATLVGDMDWRARQTAHGVSEQFEVGHAPPPHRAQ